MTRLRLAVCLVLLWAAASAAGADEDQLLARIGPVQSGDSDAPLEMVVADRGRLRDALRDVETSLPRPALGSWLEDVTTRLLDGLVALLSTIDPRLAGITAWTGWLYVLASVALLVLGYLLIVVIGWRPRSTVAMPAGDERRAAAAIDQPQAARDWDAELERALDRGDMLAALEALWWWLANRLVAERADPSWTSRELVTAARRTDLLPLVRTFDRLSYGAANPGADDVRSLWRRLREASR